MVIITTTATATATTTTDETIVANNNAVDGDRLVSSRTMHLDFNSINKGLTDEVTTNINDEEKNNDESSSHTKVQQGSVAAGGSENRIIGGDNAQPGQYPYYVQLRDMGCGGSLIAPRIVLTAAHCEEYGWDLIDQQVIVGGYEYDIGNNAGTIGWNSKTVVVKDQRIHPNYNPETIQNDFTLLLLEEPIEIPEPRLTILPGDLFDNSDTITNFPIEGMPLSVIGLGLLDAEGNEGTPDFLQHVEVPVVDADKCNALYIEHGDTDVDSKVLFCAGDTRKGGIDSCQGDSGGPIVSEDSDVLHIQLG